MTKRTWRPVVYRLRDQQSVRALARVRDAGQAALGLVIGIILLISLSAGTLAATAMQHDPLVSSDVIQHLAYRALQSGIDSYLATANDNPNIVNCNSSNTTSSSLTCPSSQLPALDSWERVVGSNNNPVTEYFMWTNPALCFNTQCSGVTSTAGQTLDYVKELVYGAAQSGLNTSYQSSYLYLVPENGFLTHLFWSNYESTVPATGDTSTCTYDWNDNYEGPDTLHKNNFNSSNCAAVFFGPGDILDGPVYSNDSIYVASDPNFGSSTDEGIVTTHDPNCQFVDPEDGDGTASTCANADNNDVGTYDAVNSSYNAQFEPLPTTDTSLETIAAENGCVYSGPTEITLHNSGTTEYMTVNSPDTPYTSSGGTTYNLDTGSGSGNSGTNQDLDTTNTNKCDAGGDTEVPVPSNEVVYIENTPSSQTCASYANPFEGESPSGTYSQLGQYLGQSSSPNCEGDAFVQGNVTGNLTIATQNNVVIDGNIEYQDCGTGFNSTTVQCAYNSSAATPNDALGLIAFAYVEVNRPLNAGYVMTTCGATGAASAPYCDPSGGSGIIIDAAILALNDGFGVNNYNTTGNGSSPFSSSANEGQLTIYGSVAQDYRPAVGEFSGTSIVAGYSKYYTWDSRLEYVNVPYYLDPGTPRWVIASTAVTQGVSCVGTPLPGVWNSADNYGSYGNVGNCTAPS